jgi:3-hydroxybutyryl-CoA dehydrogenase
MDVKVFGVVGAGQMGNGIAQVAAACGLSVIMVDVKDEFVQRGMAASPAAWTAGEKGKDTAGEMEAVMGRIKGTTISGTWRSDFVVEAATERET